MPFYAQRHQLARLQLAVGSPLAVVTKRLGWYKSADEILDQLAGGRERGRAGKSAVRRPRLRPRAASRRGAQPEPARIASEDAYLDDALLDRARDCGGPRVDVELGEDVGHVAMHGALAEV